MLFESVRHNDILDHSGRELCRRQIAKLRKLSVSRFCGEPSMSGFQHSRILRMKVGSLSSEVVTIPVNKCRRLAGMVISRRNPAKRIPVAQGSD